MPDPTKTPISTGLSSPAPMNGKMPRRIRKRVVISGTNLLIRYASFVKATASSMKIVGFFRDLHDENVEVVCEGTPMATETFLKAINRTEDVIWPLDIHVARMEETPPPSACRFEKFTIEHNDQITAEEREHNRMEHEERMDIASSILIQNSIIPGR